MVLDNRREIRAQLAVQEYTSCLSFYNRAGKERLKIGLRTDSSPLIQVEKRDIPLRATARCPCLRLIPTLVGAEAESPG